jgi:hypothetical protein
MTQQPESQDTETVVDSYPTEGEAWEQAHKFAVMLKRKGLTEQMGVTVKPMARAWVIVLVKRGS